MKPRKLCLVADASSKSPTSAAVSPSTSPAPRGHLGPTAPTRDVWSQVWSNDSRVDSQASAPARRGLPPHLGTPPFRLVGVVQAEQTREWAEDPRYDGPSPRCLIKNGAIFSPRSEIDYHPDRLSP